MNIFHCENSVDGVFSAVYYAWESKLGHDNIRITTNNLENYELFSEDIDIETNISKAFKVSNTLKKRFGEENYEYLYNTLISNAQDKAETVYRVIIFGLGLKNGKTVMDYLNNKYVFRVFELNRQVCNESHRMKEFIRFSQLSNGILFSKIRPENNVLTTIADHFSDRLKEENFIIYDEGRKLSLVHKKRSVPVLVSGQEINKKALSAVSENEMEFEELWKSFFASIAIKERTNYKLQRNMLPIRFRDNMLEFDTII